MSLKKSFIGNIPQLCLGTAQGKAIDMESYLEKAFKLGYRHFDGADNYSRPGYLESFRSFLEKHKEDRENIWITWKGSNVDLIPETLKKLEISYFDLYLIHFDYSCDSESNLQKLTQFKKNGLIKEFGVSNCLNIDKLKKYKAQFPDFTTIQIQARPNLDVLINEMKILDINVMLFSPNSGIINAIGNNIDLSGYDYIRELVAWYLQKYPTIVLVVGTFRGSSLDKNMDSFISIKYHNKNVLDAELFNEIETFLLKNVKNIAPMS